MRPLRWTIQGPKPTPEELAGIPLEKVRGSRSLCNEEDIHLGDFAEDKSVSVIFPLSAQAISKG
jgi:hypothetical protein